VTRTAWLPAGPRIGVVAIVVAVALTAACSGDPEESALTVAQTAVTKAENDLEAAEEAAADASAALCTSASDYITAIDRYGDVLTDSPATVGDVRTAGADLVDPSEDVQSAAGDVTRTQKDVVDAQEALADAQEKLAAAEAAAATDGATPEPAEPAPDPTTTVPSVPAATIDRVKQAESDFESAADGVDDATPLTEAAEEFNSAAVALESAWIQLFLQSGCLSDDDQAEAAEAVGAYTTSLQRALTDAGYDPGPVDGLYGPKTVSAVKELQADSELPETGTLDKATDAALRVKLAEAGVDEATTTAALQQTLKLAGYWDGEIDGVWSDELTAAIEQVQTDLGIEVTGVVDARTIAAAQDAFEKATSDEPDDEATEPATDESQEPEPEEPEETEAPTDGETDA
jgi:peptidoglycan hydrolase-like protein with peptidoglycan-binding domain